MSNYTQSNYERDLAIRDDAPVGATHYDEFNQYYKCDNESILIWFDEDEDEPAGFYDELGFDCFKPRSLSDIETLIAQYETIEKLKVGNEREFVKGVVYAVAEMLRVSDNSVDAREILFSAGVDQLKAYLCCDSFDIGVIDKKLAWPDQLKELT